MNWIPTDQEMPKSGKRVLVRFLNGDQKIPRITIGCYIPKHFRDASTCDNDVDEWSEEDDKGEFWWPEGWWEDVCIAERVDRIPKVTHWMPLPSANLRTRMNAMKYFIAICLALSLGGCTAQERARSFGGTATEKLPPGRKLLNVTWKDEHLWFFTREMVPADKPETYRFSESSSWGVLNGEVTIIESR